jgi:2Fe-2S ferredoxin
MPVIKYIESGGAVHLVQATVGHSLMEAAVKAGVPGIIAECGGSCACATCHVYVDSEWIQRVGPPGPMEKDMLECTLEPRTNSRLSCQITATAEMDGLVLTIPAS